MLVQIAYRLACGEGALYQALRGENILSCLKRHGLKVASGCQKGYCGVCRHRLIKGQVSTGRQEALTQTEQDEGFILICMSKIEADIDIEASPPK